MSCHNIRIHNNGKEIEIDIETEERNREIEIELRKSRVEQERKDRIDRAKENYRKLQQRRMERKDTE